jgi:hypothetical protein
MLIPSRIGKLQGCRWRDPKFRTEENYFRYYLEPKAGTASPSAALQPSQKFREKLNYIFE